LKIGDLSLNSQENVLAAMNVRIAFLVIILSACSSHEDESAETVSIETPAEMRAEDAVEASAELQGASPFVRSNELVVLSFRTKKQKRVYVCRDQDNKYLVYRFGSKSNVELQFPEKPDSSSFKKFEYSSYLRPGGVENLGMSLDYLSFTNSGYRYVIYKTYASESVGNEDEIGIRVIHLKTRKETQITGDYTSLVGGFPEEIMKLVRQSDTLYE
jgi:hypothetical protein